MGTNTIATTTLDRLGSWKATSGGSALEMVDTKYTDRLVFKIPQDATNFQVTYRPKGTLEYSYSSTKLSEGHHQEEKDVTAPEAETVDIKFS